MAKNVCGPTDRWPQLEDKDCNEQAKRARSLGWKAIPKRSHGGFVICCPGGKCEVRFDSSPKNPTAKAKEARDIILSCPHNGEHNDALAAATEAMEKAERLISAVEKRLESKTLWHRAMTSELIGLLERAAELEDEALGIISTFEDLGEDEEDNESGWMDRSRRYLSNARDKLQPMRKQKPVRRDVSAAWKRYKQAKGRLDRVKKLVQE